MGVRHNPFLNVRNGRKIGETQLRDGEDLEWKGRCYRILDWKRGNSVLKRKLDEVNS